MAWRVEVRSLLLLLVPMLLAVLLARKPRTMGTPEGMMHVIDACHQPHQLLVMEPAPSLRCSNNPPLLVAHVLRVLSLPPCLPAACLRLQTEDEDESMYVNWWDAPTNPDAWHKHQVRAHTQLEGARGQSALRSVIAC